MNPLRLAILAASPFCFAKRGGLFYLILQFRHSVLAFCSAKRGGFVLPDGVAAVYWDGGSGYEVGGV